MKWTRRARMVFGVPFFLAGASLLGLGLIVMLIMLWIVGDRTENKLHH